jgi:hypothetical protein
MVLTFGLLGATVPAAAQDTGVEPVLRIGTRAMTQTGVPGRDAALERRGPSINGTTYLLAGRAEQPEGQLCVMRAVSSEMGTLDPKTLSMALHVWKISTTTVTFEEGRQTFDVEWQRVDRGSDITAVSGKHRLTLDDGQTYTLDLVRGSDAAPCRTPAVVVELRASVSEDPALADTVLRYDLWLVRQDRTGKTERQHLFFTGAHGDAVDFRFAALQSDVEKLQADQYDYRVATRVSGTVRGRMTRGGQVSIDLETRRSDGLERTGSRVNSGPPPRPGGGRKVLTAALGEAIEVQLPPGTRYSSALASAKDEAERRARPSGTRANAASEPDATQRLRIRDGRLEVNYGPFFEGERLSVIVQVRKADAVAEEPLPARVSPATASR